MKDAAACFWFRLIGWTVGREGLNVLWLLFALAASVFLLRKAFK